jgi:hypothetical protein
MSSMDDTETSKVSKLNKASDSAATARARRRVKAPSRKPTTSLTEAAVLGKAARRCVLCFALDGNLDEQHGQIAHLDRDRSNSAEGNLAFMCLKHHSIYDSTTRQHKNYTIEEVKAARLRLHDLVATGKYLDSDVLRVHHEEADRRTLSKFLALLPFNGVITFLIEHDFRAAYRLSDLDNLRRFYYDYGGPEHEFLNSELESSRRELREAIRQLLSTLASKTFSADAGANFVGVPSEWEYEAPERYREAVDKIHENVKAVLTAYDATVRLARRKLCI